MNDSLYYQSIETITGFDYAFDTTDADGEWSDDGAVGIVRNGVCYVFYRGQGKNEFTSKDVPRFRKLVDAVLKQVPQ